MIELEMCLIYFENPFPDGISCIPKKLFHKFLSKSYFKNLILEILFWKSYISEILKTLFQNAVSNWEGTGSNKTNEIVNQFRDPAHSMVQFPELKKKYFPCHNSPFFLYLDKHSHTYFQGKIKFIF